MKLQDGPVQRQGGGEERGQERRGGGARPQRGGDRRGSRSGRGGRGREADAGTSQREFGPSDSGSNPFAAQLSKLNLRKN